MTRPGGVTAAAVVSLLWSLVMLLFGIGVAFAAFVPSATPRMSNYTAFMLTFGVVTIGLSALGIATAVGLFRLKSWARTSILVFAGFAAPLCLLTAAAAALVPLSDTPGLPTEAESIVRVAAVGIYALPLLITIWWLVQFSSSTTKAAFHVSAGKPLIVLIIGWGNLVGGVACLIPVVMGMPALALGFILRGVAAQTFYLVFGALSAYLGWGLLKMQERARILTLVWLGLITLNSLYATLLPSARARMIELQSELGGMQATPEFDMTAFFVASMVATVVLIAVGAWLLVRAKPAFLAPTAPARDESSRPAAEAPPV